MASNKRVVQAFENERFNFSTHTDAGYKVRKLWQARLVHTTAGHCVLCWRKLNREHNNPCQMSLHHVVERSEGGLNTKENLILVCSWCHENLHGKTFKFYSGKGRMHFRNMRYTYGVVARSFYDKPIEVESFYA